MKKTPRVSVQRVNMVDRWLSQLHEDMLYLQQSLRTLIHTVERNKVDRAPEYQDHP